MAELVYLVIYSGILFDIGIRGRNIGFRLIVVIVRDEIFYRVFREKLSELGTELRRESLVVGENKSRTVEIGDYIRHCKGFAGSRYAEQGLFGKAPVDSVGQLGYRLWLISRWFILRM